MGKLNMTLLREKQTELHRALINQKLLSRNNSLIVTALLVGIKIGRDSSNQFHTEIYDLVKEILALNTVDK